MGNHFLLKLFTGVERKKIIWNPTINKEICTNCGLCSNFCKHEVYGNNGNNIIEVISPINCILLCNRCVKICPNKAISFPNRSNLLDQISSLKVNKGTIEL